MKELSKYKIIIIDNNMNERNTVNNTFPKYYCKVDMVSNEKTALHKIKSNDYDFYFINIWSEEIGGFYLMDFIKEKKKNYKIISCNSNPSILEIKKIISSEKIYFE